MSKVPVVLIFFRRKTVFDVFEKIRAYEPTRLFLIADGGRTMQEKAQCHVLRKAIEQRIDWDCTVTRIYSNNNLGCRKRIPTGLDVVFSKVDRAIILEDDCVPAPDFFTFCEDLLERYYDDKRIFTISGANFLRSKDYFGRDDYLFSAYAEQWGWATWKRAWELYDPEITNWPQAKKQKALDYLPLSPGQLHYWENVFEEVYKKTVSCDPWDYQWLFMSWINRGLSIVPRENLVTNIGCNAEGTHTMSEESPIANIPLGSLKLANHPLSIVANEEFDKDYGKLVFGDPQPPLSLPQELLYKAKSAVPSNIKTVLKRMFK